MANHGGKRAGAGRKPKAEEQKLIEKLDNIIDSEEALQKLKELIVVDGDYRALALYLSYRYGKPKETVETSHKFDGFNIYDVVKFNERNEDNSSS